MNKTNLPGPAGMPLIGSLIPYIRDQPGFLMDCYRRFGPAIRFHFLGLRGAILCGPEANRYILVEAVDNFLVAPLIDRYRARWVVGYGLLFIDNPTHLDHRRLLMPTMHRKRLEAYHQMMVNTTTQILDRWVAGSEIDLDSEMDDLALISAGKTLFNVDFSVEARELSEAVAVVIQTTNDVFRLGFAQLPFDVPGLGAGRSLRRAIARIDMIVNDFITAHEQAGRDLGDMFSALLEARDEEGGGLSRDQIRDHLLTLFVAGHETVANALTWGCYLLAQHPHVAGKLLSELENELGGRPPTMADLGRLPYLEMVAKEILRIYPPATSLFRTAREPFEWQGVALPAGSTIMYTPYVSHRIPDYFPDPERFWPERFDPAVSDPPPSFAYIPFGGGSRACLGAPFAMLEIKTVLAMILQRYRLDLVPDQNVVATVRTTLQARYGLRVRVHEQDGHPEHSPAAVRGNVVGATPGPA